MLKPAKEIKQFTQKVKIERNFDEIKKYFNNNYNSFKNNLSRHFNSAKNKSLFHLIGFNSLYLIKKIINFITRTVKFILIKSKLIKSLQSYYNSLCDVNPDFEKKFIYFPLHYQPELSTSPLAEDFVNQELIVAMISKKCQVIVTYTLRSIQE